MKKVYNLGAWMILCKQNVLNLCILHMFKGTFLLGETQLIKAKQTTSLKLKKPKQLQEPIKTLPFITV